MRRKDREVTDPAKIEDIISRCSCCRIGFYDGEEVYIVPMNFGYEKKDDTYFFYFHGAKEGRKFELICKRPNVGFEMDTDSAVYAKEKSDTACTYTCRFQSVIGNGVMSVVSDWEEKKRGFSLLMAQNTGKQEWEFDQKTLEAAAVFRLEATKISCKEHP